MHLNSLSTEIKDNKDKTKIPFKRKSDPIFSLFDKTSHTKNGARISSFDFYAKIRTGFWEDSINALRVENDIEKRKRIKADQLPCVTLSGTFEPRNASGQIEHSGLIGIDIDDLNERVNEVKSTLCCDEHVVACFTSASGNGLCVVFKINPKAHKESYIAASAYIEKKFDVETKSDPSCKDVSRLRFVSFDPDIHVNQNALIFHVKPEKASELKKNKPVEYAVSDQSNERVFREIQERRIDITALYPDWINAGIAIGKVYGESGRSHFHNISQFHPDYDYARTDRKYDNLLNTAHTDMGMGVIYNIAKKYGITIYSPEERKVIQQVQGLKSAGKSLDQVRTKLIENGYTQAQIAELNPIISEAHVKDLPKFTGGLVDDVKLYVSSNYTLRRNVISRSIEKDGKAISDIDINTIYLNTRSAASEKVTKDLVKSVLYSDFTVEYNPFKDFIETYSNSSLKEVNLNKLIKSIQTDTPYHGLWIKKWMVGIIASIFEDHSPLMLVLCGGQNTGKTQWFRRLLPEPLQAYFAECKFQNGKDDEILMTQKAIILDDELSGKSKNEESKIKALLSKQYFYLRAPYGSVQECLRRLAVLCGTTNLLQILNDPTGNRRFLPINVISIDHELYNNVNKYHLFIECYNLYKSGTISHHLSKDEIELLNSSTQKFETSNSETELINKYYKAPSDPDELRSDTMWITGAEILSKIKYSSGLNIQISPEKLGLTLKKLGFVNKSFKVNSAIVRKYKVIEVTEPVYPNTNLYTSESAPE